MALEVVSKPQIRFKGKASGRSGKRSIREYVSIYRRTATQPLSLRWGFGTTSSLNRAKVFIMNAGYIYKPQCIIKTQQNAVDQKGLKRMKIAVALAVVAIAIAVNIVFKWFSKKSKKAQTAVSSNPRIESYTFSKGYLNTPQVSQLRKSAAAELGLSIEELDRMLAKEMKQMAAERELINDETTFRSQADLSTPGN